MKKLAAAVLCFIAFSAHAENVVVQQARQAGMKHCMPAIEKIANFLIDDGNAGAHSVWNSVDPDKNAFSSMIERNFSDGVIVTNLNVTHTATGACYVEYEKIIQFNKSCLATSQEFKDAKYTGELNKEIGALNHDGVHVYLIPMNGNCIAVRKEIIMDGREL